MTLTIVPGSAGRQHPGARAPDPQPQAKESMALGKPLRVLIVDDEPSICKALTMLLSRTGYEPVTALTGESALAIVRSEHVDVMLLDLRIPDMRGDTIFHSVVAAQPQLRMQTLFITGDITDRGELLITGCGCNYLRKPFDLRDLTDAVAALAPQSQDAAG